MMTLEARLVLGVEFGASREKIKAAYRRRAKEAHESAQIPSEHSRKTIRRAQKAHAVLQATYPTSRTPQEKARRASVHSCGSRRDRRRMTPPSR